MRVNLMRDSITVLIGLGLLLITRADASAATLKPNSVKAWEIYVQLTEKRIAAELDNPSRFLRNPERRAGRLKIEKLNTTMPDGKEVKVPDGLIHHWSGSIFVPGVSVESLLKWVKDYDQHHRYFKEVEQSKLVSRSGDTFNIFLRFVRKKVVTVHYNTDHTVIYRHHADGQESSRSFTTRIAELQNAGTASEREKPSGEDSGFLWRLNSYWRFRGENGGVVIECESISLSRSIPFGFGWLVKGFVESVPQESLESTLISIRDGVLK
jgi:hypothetical protein